MICDLVCDGIDVTCRCLVFVSAVRAYGGYAGANKRGELTKNQGVLFVGWRI